MRGRSVSGWVKLKIPSAFAEYELKRARVEVKGVLGRLREKLEL